MSIISQATIPNIPPVFVPLPCVGVTRSIWEVRNPELAALLKEALVWLKPEGIEDTAGDVTAWRNSGTGGATWDLFPLGGTPTVSTYEGKRVVDFPALTATAMAPALLQAKTTPLTEIGVVFIRTIDVTDRYLWTGHGDGGSSLRMRCFVDSASGSTFTFGYPENPSIVAGVGYDNRPVVCSIVNREAGSVQNVDELTNTAALTGGVVNLLSLGNSTTLSLGIFDGWQGEHLLFDRGLDAAELDLIGDYLSGVWQ